MLHKSFKPAKCKTSLKLAASRIKLLKNRKDVQIKQLRREVAQLLDSGQVQTARIRVEHVNREEKTMGAYNLIGIYCELIASRLSIIESQKNCPIDLKEAIASVVFASPRCADVPELADVRKHFKAKYGKDFISASVELRPDCGVNRSLVEKLSAKTPDGVTKVKILIAIAEEHNIKWDPNTFGGNETTSQDDLLKGPSTFEKASRMHEEPPNVRMPYNPQASPSFDIGSHKAANVEPVKNLNARAAFSSQSVPPSPEHIRTPANSDLGMFSSGNVGEGYETRRRYSGDSNINCVDRPDWNMEFTDATTAAQVAAESAERASIAARAAAELSILGRVTPRYAPDSHGFKKERIEIPSTPSSPAEAPTRSQVNNASVDRNSGLAYDHFGDERIERPPILRSPGEAPPKIQVNNASVGRSSGAYDHFGDERLERPPVVLSPGEAPFRSQVNNASVGRSPGLAYDHFRDERLERTPSLCSPGESPPRSWVNNASVSRNSGLAYDNVGKNEENLLHDHKSYNTLGKSSSYKSNPDVGLIFHSGPVTGDGTIVSDAYTNQGEVSEDDDSLSGITKKLHRYAYKKGSKYDEPISGDAVGDVDASVHEQHSAGRYTEMNRWSAGLKNGDISNRRNERKNSFGEVNRTTHSSEIHARRESVEYVESFVRFTPEMKESYGYEKDSSHASTWSQPSRSSSFAEKKDFSSLSNEKAEGGFAENLFDDRDEERISVGSNAAGGSLAVFDDYGSDDDVYVFDLDKGHTSHDSGKTGPEQTSANFLEKSSSAAHYSQENQLFVDVPSSKAASESEEDLPVTSYDSDGPSFENEEAPGKSRAPGKIGDFVDKKLSGSSKFTSVSKAEGADSSSSRPVILADKSEQEMTSDSGKVLPYGNILPGIRNRRRLPPPVAGTMTDKDSWTDQRREGPRFSPSNSTSTDKASDEDPDIHYVEDQVMTRPNRRVQTNFVVSHEMTIPQLNTESRPVMHDYGDEEVELDANYWKKPSTRPTKNYSAEKIRLSSQSSLLSDSGQNSDVAEGRPSQVSPGNSHVGAVSGLSRRAKVGPSSTYHSTSGKPSSDAENSGFSPRSTDRGKNSEKPRVRTNAPDGSKSSGPLKWRSGEPKASSKESPKKTAANNQSSVPTGKEDATESSKPAKPILDSTSREKSLRASHVHPKMPDYETFIANLKTLRANRQ